MHTLTRKALAGSLAAVALIPATAAFAATIDGGPGGERLRGTNYADAIDGNGGNDRIVGRGGDDALHGGAGDDRIFGNAGDDKLWGDSNGVGDRTSHDLLSGGAGNDTLTGGDSRDRIFGGPGNDVAYGQLGNDRIAGGSGDDVLAGNAGDDTIFANAGVDAIYGGDGDDHLWAMARSDVRPGPNGAPDQVGDTLDGGVGDDVFRTRDGEVDRITCGPGRDVVYADSVDVMTDATAENPTGSCERVIRKAPGAGEDGGENATQAPAEANVPAR